MERQLKELQERYEIVSRETQEKNERWLREMREV